MGLRKTSADSLSTLHRLEECASFSNPFSGSSHSARGGWGALREKTNASKENKVGSRPVSVNPWSEAVPIQAKSASLRGVQRGNSAAMDVLRSSPHEYMMGELLGLVCTVSPLERNLMLCCMNVASDAQRGLYTLWASCDILMQQCKALLSDGS